MVTMRTTANLTSFFFFQAEDGIRDHCVTGVQTCALPISCPEYGPTPVATNINHESNSPRASAFSGRNFPVFSARYNRITLLSTLGILCLFQLSSAPRRPTDRAGPLSEVRNGARARNADAQWQ